MCREMNTKKWLHILLCLLIVLRTESSLVDITYVENAVSKGAVCLDGSPPAYHFEKGSGAGTNNWLLRIEGGAWCNNVTDCLSRKNSRLGSSKLMPKQFEFDGIISGTEESNPDFYNLNRVYVRYCDGASFTGDIEAVDPATGLHYRGARVFVAIIEDLLVKGMKNAENALLSGCSAGGLSAILKCDTFKSLLPERTKTKCLSDGGFFINAKDISGASHIESYFNDVVITHGSAKTLPQSCTSKLKPSLCFFPQNMAQGIQTPLFILNAAYDSWQIGNVLAPKDADPQDRWHFCKNNLSKCNATQLATVQDFRSEFINALSGLGPSTSRGYFINSCFAHCQTKPPQWLSSNSPELDNKKIAEAVGDWFYERSPFQKIDCPYPCDNTCFRRTSSEALENM